MARNTTSTAVRLSCSFDREQPLLNSPQVPIRINMDNGQQQSVVNFEYSDSEYDDDDEPPSASNTSTAIRAEDHRSQPSLVIKAMRQQNDMHDWKQSRDTRETEMYLRRNGFDLRYSLGTDSSDSYLRSTDVSLSSATSNADLLLLPSSDIGRHETTSRGPGRIWSSTPPRLEQDSSLKFSPMSMHRRQSDITSAKVNLLDQSLKEVCRVSERNPLRNPLTPLPLNITSTNAARRNTYGLERRNSPSNTPKVARLGGRIASQTSQPTAAPHSSSQRMDTLALDPIASDTDMEGLLPTTRQKTEKDLLSPQGVLSVTDLRPAQASRNPSHILRFQVVPSQPSPLSTTQDTQDLVTGCSIRRYVTDLKAPLSTTSLPLRRSETKRMPKLSVKEFIHRCKRKVTQNARI